MDDDVLSEVADNIQSMAQSTARLKQVCCGFFLSFFLIACFTVSDSIWLSSNGCSFSSQFVAKRGSGSEYWRNVTSLRETTMQISAATMDKLRNYRAPAEEKRRYERLMVQYRQVFKSFEEASKDSLIRERDQISNSPAASSSSAMMGGGGRNGASAYDDNENLAYQRVQLKQQSQHVNDALVRERNEELLDIDNHLSLLKEAFEDVQSMVHAQQDEINTIDDNVHYAGDKVEKGKEQLIVAEQLQNSARYKLCIICIVVTVILAVIFLILLILSASFALTYAQEVINGAEKVYNQLYAFYLQIKEDIQKNK
mgnify:CR=1 FL=1